MFTRGKLLFVFLAILLSGSIGFAVDCVESFDKRLNSNSPDSFYFDSKSKEVEELLIHVNYIYKNSQKEFPGQTMNRHRREYIPGSKFPNIFKDDLQKGDEKLVSLMKEDPKFQVAVQSLAKFVLSELAFVRKNVKAPEGMIYSIRTVTLDKVIEDIRAKYIGWHADGGSVISLFSDIGGTLVRDSKNRVFTLKANQKLYLKGTRILGQQMGLEKQDSTIHSAPDFIPAGRTLIRITFSLEKKGAQRVQLLESPWVNLLNWKDTEL